MAILLSQKSQFHQLLEISTTPRSEDIDYLIERWSLDLAGRCSGVVNSTCSLALCESESETAQQHYAYASNLDLSY